MAIPSPSITAVNNIIFGAGYDYSNDDENKREHDDSEHTMNLGHVSNGHGKRQSMYVTLFEGE